MSYNRELVFVIGSCFINAEIFLILWRQPDGDANKLLLIECLLCQAMKITSDHKS